MFSFQVPVAHFDGIPFLDPDAFHFGYSRSYRVSDRVTWRSRHAVCSVLRQSESDWFHGTRRSTH